MSKEKKKELEDKVKLKYEKRIEKLKETIMEQEEKIVQLYQELVDRKIQNDILERELEKIKEEKLKIEARTKTEREQKIDEILKITKNIEGYINTQTKC